MPLSERAVNELKRQVRGEVILPAALEYDVHRRVFNAGVNKRPALIVRCTGTEDVIASIRFAAKHDLAVSTKGGGHGPTGFAVCDDGLLVDLSLMRRVLVNPRTRTAIVQGGALWRDVYREAAAFGLVPAGGTCDMVGVAGHTLGGGVGYLSRKFGLAIDSLDRVHLVTADGKLVTASETEHRELFWALRGGGGGNFGVVTLFEYRLHPLPPLVFGGTLTWPYKRARQVLERYRDRFSAGFPDELYVDVSLSGSPESGREVSVTAVYLGFADDGSKMLEPFVKLAPSKGCFTYRTFESILKSYADEIVEGRLQLWKGAFLKPRVTDKTIRTIVDRFARPPSVSSLFFIEPLGGAIGRFDAKKTAYAHRDQPMCATIIGIWSDTSQTAAMERWTRDFKRALKSAYSGAAYVNYPDTDLDLDDWPTAYYGANYARLVKVKRNYDRDDVFRFAQSIGSRR